MNIFLKSLKPAGFVLFVFTVLLGFVYPFFVWVVGQSCFPKHANGCLVYDQEGRVVGSEFIAQRFIQPEYFHPRPSVNEEYDGLHSSCSNLGQTSQTLIDTLEQRAQRYRLENHLQPGDALPVDAITASGSGLDPHISVANAMIQAVRIANTRGIDVKQVMQVIHEHTETSWLFFVGPKWVNVLRMNLALDKLHQSKRSPDTNPQK